jgi:hypothetical protein
MNRTHAQTRFEPDHLTGYQRTHALSVVKLFPEDRVAVAFDPDLARAAHLHLGEKAVQIEIRGDLVELDIGARAGARLALHHAIEILGVEGVDTIVGASGDLVLKIANQLLDGILGDGRVLLRALGAPAQLASA